MKTPLRTTLFAAVAVAFVPLAAHASEYAAVVSATPVTAQVNVPQRVCTDEQQYVQPQPSGAGALIGAIAGGVLGNQFGGGFGRAAATGLGVAAGAVVGNSVEANANPPAVVPVRRCRTVAGYASRAVGYDVVYEYAGQRYTTRMARDPGAQIAIDVRPSGAVADAAPPPAGYDEAPPPPYYDAPQRPYYAPVVATPPLIYVSPFIGYGYHRGHHAWR